MIRTSSRPVATGRARVRPVAWRHRLAPFFAFALLLNSLVAALVWVGGAPAQAATTGCSYATGSSGAFANTLCWFDFSGYSEALATSAAGQPFIVQIDGGYTATFNLKTRPVQGCNYVATVPRTPAQVGQSAWGNHYYNTTPGQPVLQNIADGQGTPGACVQWTLDNIVMLGPNGNPVTDFALVSGDAEQTSQGEVVVFESDAVIGQLEVLTGNPPQPNGCIAANASGAGTTRVQCDGTGSGVADFGIGSNILWASTSPTFLSQTVTSNSRNAGVFGFMMSKVKLNKIVDGRSDADDSFGLSVTDDSSTLATASTGTANTATTGDVTTLASSSITLTEQAEGDTDLANYDTSWVCEVNGTENPGITPADGETSLTIGPNDVGLGDYVECTITNATLPPAIELVKEVDTTQLVTGETATYTLTATNTGNTTLTDVVIEEDEFTGSGEMSDLDCTPSMPAALAIGEQLNCTATYEVTQADVDAGRVDNTATATATDPGGNEVGDSDNATVPADHDPGLDLDKRVASVVDVNDNDLTDAGDEINWEFEVTNTGNVTIDNIEVNDPMAGVVTCDPNVLAPAESVVCLPHAPYVITQDDVKAGNVHNVATATGDTPTNEEIRTPPDETDTPTDTFADMTVDKRVSKVTDVNGNGRNDAGDMIDFDFEVTNTGTVPLTDVRVRDPKLARLGITITCDPDELDPGESVVCVAGDPYVISAADVERGGVHNVATAQGTPPGEPAIDSPPDETDTPTQGPPATTPPPPDPPSGLPNTGSPDGLLFLAAASALMVLLGTAALVWSRRDQRQQPGPQR